jgi:hypothetical protein
MISSLQISGSALEAERLRLDTITENIANAQTTRAENGQPYQRKQVVFEVKPGEPSGAAGVKASVVASNDPVSGSTNRAIPMRMLPATCRCPTSTSSRRWSIWCRPPARIRRMSPR